MKLLLGALVLLFIAGCADSTCDFEVSRDGVSICGKMKPESTMTLAEHKSMALLAITNAKRK